MPLDLQRKDHFLQLAVVAAIGAIEEKAAGQLHRQRAGTLGFAMLHDVAKGSLHHARQVDAEMLFEVLILGANDRVAEDRRNLLVGDEDAALQRKRPDRLAIVGVKLGDDVGTIILESANLRQFAAVDKIAGPAPRRARWRRSPES